MKEPLSSGKILVEQRIRSQFQKEGFPEPTLTWDSEDGHSNLRVECSDVFVLRRFDHDDLATYPDVYYPDVRARVERKILDIMKEFNPKR